MNIKRTREIIVSSANCVWPVKPWVYAGSRGWFACIVTILAVCGACITAMPACAEVEEGESSEVVDGRQVVERNSTGPIRVSDELFCHSFCEAALQCDDASGSDWLIADASMDDAARRRGDRMHATTLAGANQSAFSQCFEKCTEDGVIARGYASRCVQSAAPLYMCLVDADVVAASTYCEAITESWTVDWSIVR